MINEAVSHHKVGQWERVEYQGLNHGAVEPVTKSLEVRVNRFNCRIVKMNGDTSGTYSHCLLSNCYTPDIKCLK